MKRGLIVICSLFVLSSCVSNSVNVKPNPKEYSHLANSPVYIKRAVDTDLETFELELDQCMEASATKTDISSKIGVGVGSVWLAAGLYGLATASGIFAPIAVAAGTVGTIAGGSALLLPRPLRSTESMLALKIVLRDRGTR